jgi:protein disulfide-isomerase
MTRFARILVVAMATAAAVRGLSADAPRVLWQRDYKTACQAAEQSGRPLLIQFTGRWCPSCLRLERVTLLDPAVIETINRSCVAVKLDADFSPTLLKRFAVERLPVTVVLSPSGIPLGRIEGYRPADKYAAELARLIAEMPRSVASSGMILVPPLRVASRARSHEQNEIMLTSLRTGARVASDGVLLSGYLEPLLALDGYCPVSLVESKKLVPGRSELQADHAGHTYWFAGSSERARFAADPRRYVPVLDGMCVASFVNSHKLVPGDARYGAIHRGRLHLFAGPEERQRFQADPAVYVDKIAEREAHSAE